MTHRCLAALSLLLAACSFDASGLQHGTGDDASTIDGPATDACVPSTEVCDGIDNDCDGDIDEGLTSGVACDGPDADLCLDDHMTCDATGHEVCGDTSGGDNPELCNGVDDDCDGTIDEDFALDVPCDGLDGDVCLEGVTVCSTDHTTTACTDQTDTIVEICDHQDQDCDGIADNGFDFTSDEQNCGDCGVVCSPVANATNTCQSSHCTTVCNNGAAECDGNPANGCELQDTNPTCGGTSAVADATVNGDAAQTAILTGTTERFLRIHLRESVSGNTDLTARLALVSGVGTKFNLFVYCTGCGGTASSDPSNILDVGRTDQSGVDRSFDVIAEVRYDPTSPSSTCAAWTLTVTSAVTTANRCAN